ncbi:hypothetical protein NIES2119_14050 [[Phormidium ambiguum] IAM M-71]|uniref:DM13 domain-containing protein n=1 Tax=[Phormidium ambiguum] IAM M-71 TaxID=454136 RepID=A0A1U7IJG9_9CYAN|nr:DM13 domain-containing protein [Phormidium ambiguum]OKH37364.1 hypothetical protein NIES2119_14050 [Phormidium ambiguum IAM M-71]
MKRKNLLTLSIVALLIGCTTQETTKQPSITPVAENVSASTQSLANVKSNVVKSGAFVSGEHPTTGTASVVNKDGKSFLELDRSFKTSNMGPDLVVILHRSNNILASTKPPAYPLRQGEYVILAPLKKFSGTQSYAIPNNINLTDYKSAAIWCRKFNATFGAATFK